MAECHSGPFTTDSKNRIHRQPNSLPTPAVSAVTAASIYRTPNGDYKVLLAGTVGALWATSLGDAMALAYSLTSTPTLG